MDRQPGCDAGLLLRCRFEVSCTSLLLFDSVFHDMRFVWSVLDCVAEVGGVSCRKKIEFHDDMGVAV